MLQHVNTPMNLMRTTELNNIFDEEVPENQNKEAVPLTRLARTWPLPGNVNL